MVGSLLPHHELGDVPVCAVAAHDTASAFAAAPLRDRTSAVLSSGTWSLLGLELDEPVLDEDARAFDLSNERGLDGTTRLLRNVMGLWLLQESRRALEPAGSRGYEDLLHLAEAVSDDVPLFDPDDEDLLGPGDMPGRIASACVRAGQAPPASTGELVRSILVSLACKYRLVLERLEQVTGRSVETIHVIGGGARNALLCQITADVLGRRVLAGPVEATALGNVLVQARAAGELASLDEMRTVAAASAQLATYEPRDDAAGDETYARFLRATAPADERTKT
jgi:rhamnulokinase